MNADEFLKQVLPASKPSRLAPYLNDLNMLRQSGYTFKQAQDFLRRNDVTISIGGLAAYLQRQSNPRIEKPTPKGQYTTAPAKSSPIVKSETEPEPKSSMANSHNPADLDKIIRSNPDLAALSKFAKKVGRSKG